LSNISLSTRLKKILRFFLIYNTEFIVIILVVISSTISDFFFTERNIFNLLRQVSGIGIISMGMLMTILTGGIDLSVGSQLALGSVLSAYFLTSMSLPLPFSMFLTILICVIFSSISGYLVAYRSMNAFVATLAIMTIARGEAFIISKGAPIIIEDSTLLSFGNNYFLGIPLPVFLTLVVFLITYFLLKNTVYGRLVKAIGSNEVAVDLCGINIRTYKFSVYAISGSLAAIAGIISTARTGVGSPLVGQGVELDAIAAVVIGGASLKGGKGEAFKTLLGVLILGMIGNIMNLTNVPAYPQQVVKGLIIIFAVIFQGVQNRLK